MPRLGLTLNRWSIFGNHLDYTSRLFPVSLAWRWRLPNIIKFRQTQLLSAPYQFSSRLLFQAYRTPTETPSSFHLPPLAVRLLTTYLKLVRNHRFSYPPFRFILSSRPGDTFADLFFLSAFFTLALALLLFYLKDWNIFCFVLSLLYPYYSTEFSFVKGFFKNFLDFFKIF